MKEADFEKEIFKRLEKADANSRYKIVIKDIEKIMIKNTLIQFEKARYYKVKSKSRGHQGIKSNVAIFLGINRATLDLKINEYNLNEYLR